MQITDLVWLMVNMNYVSIPIIIAVSIVLKFPYKVEQTAGNSERKLSENITTPKIYM